MTMLNIQKRNSYFTGFLTLFCLQSCYAQDQQIKNFFEDKKKNAYENCVKESEIDKIIKNGEIKETVNLMLNDCKDESKIFDNFIDGTNALLASLPGRSTDFIIFNWKKYDTYIPSPTVSILQIDKTQVIEFTYYDEERNAYDTPLKRKVYEEKEGKFKNELLYIQYKLNGEKMDDSMIQYQRNDYYIIKRIKGKYFYYTILNGKLETR